MPSLRQQGNDDGYPSTELHGHEHPQQEEAGGSEYPEIAWLWGLAPRADTWTHELLLHSCIRPPRSRCRCRAVFPECLPGRGGASVCSGAAGGIVMQSVLTAGTPGV